MTRYSMSMPQALESPRIWASAQAILTRLVSVWRLILIVGGTFLRWGSSSVKVEQASWTSRVSGLLLLGCSFKLLLTWLPHLDQLHLELQAERDPLSLKLLMSQYFITAKGLELDQHALSSSAVTSRGVCVGQFLQPRGAQELDLSNVSVHILEHLCLCGGTWKNSPGNFPSVLYVSVVVWKKEKGVLS